MGTNADTDVGLSEGRNFFVSWFMPWILYDLYEAMVLRLGDCVNDIEFFRCINRLFGSMDSSAQSTLSINLCSIVRTSYQR